MKEDGDIRNGGDRIREVKSGTAGNHSYVLPHLTIITGTDE